MQVADADGRVLASTRGSVVQRRSLAALAIPAGAVRARRLDAGDSAPVPYRVAARTAVVDGRRLTVYAALPADDVDDTRRSLVLALLAGLPVLVAAVGAGTWLLVGRAVSPVERMRAQVADISAARLDARLDVPPTGDELAALAGTLNDLLDRLASSVRRERRLVADAAHELRSPVAAVLARAELAARHDHRAADLVDDVRRLARLVDDLLVLARLQGDDARPAGGASAPVDLDDVVLGVVRAATPRDGRTVDTRAVAAAQVPGQRGMLERFVRNLLDNALRHARTTVTLSLTTEGQHAELVVCDDGPGIPVEARDRVFERFTRLDEARDRDAGGVGLGLAIVRDVVAAHGGTVTIEEAAPGARVVVRLPLATVTEPAPEPEPV